jgi:hypothetical protein
VKLVLSSCAVGALFILIACNKSSDTTPPDPVRGVDSVRVDSVRVDNLWECTINGVLYNGTIDTSFANIIASGGQDTMVYCTGTSLDKRSNIYFRIGINRTSWRKSTFSTIAGTATLAFDTSTTDLYKASANSGAEIIYTVDTLAEGKLKARFSGTIGNATNGGPAINVTNGKFSCEFGKGRNEPKTFSFNENTTLRNGYVKSATIITNTLVLDCLPFSYYAEQRFKLMIRTGGTVKTGTYNSQDGDVGLQYYSPSYYPLYITEASGNLSVTINSVAGNIVTGVFSGSNADGKQISLGRFSCMIKNYQPQADLVNSWKFGFDESSTYLYTLYGGNVLNASKTQTGTRNLLTVNGESDHGASKFKIVISSPTPITTGVYKSGLFSSRVDSLYFTSKQLLWNGNTTYLFSDDYSDTYVRIDSIDNQKVVGALFGRIKIRFSSAGYSSSDIRKGSFRASL